MTKKKNIEFFEQSANIFVPDGIESMKALQRSTHMALGAHQDDIEIFAYHGIGKCFGQSDRWFAGVVVTDGAGSPRSGIYEDFTDEQMRDVRRREQQKAAYVGEYGIQIQLSHPSSAVKDSKNKNVREDIKKILEMGRPDIIYLHNPADKHDTHVAVFLRCIEAIRELPKNLRPSKAFGCEVWRDLDWLMDEDKQPLKTNRFENIASSLVDVFDSQISGGKRYDLATTGRRRANATYFTPNSVDEVDALTWAIDLTPLIRDDSISIVDYTLSFIDRFKIDVESRIRKFK